MDIPFKVGQEVYVIEKVEKFHYETRRGGWDHLGALPDKEVRITDGYEKRVAKKRFYFGLLDYYDVDEIFTNKADAEAEMRKEKREDLAGKIVSYKDSEGVHSVFVEKQKGNRIEGMYLSSSSTHHSPVPLYYNSNIPKLKRASVDLDNGDIYDIETREITAKDVDIIVAIRQNRIKMQEDELER